MSCHVTFTARHVWKPAVRNYLYGSGRSRSRHDEGLCTDSGSEDVADVVAVDTILQESNSSVAHFGQRKLPIVVDLSSQHGVRLKAEELWGPATLKAFCGGVLSQAKDALQT